MSDKQLPAERQPGAIVPAKTGFRALPVGWQMAIAGGGLWTACTVPVSLLLIPKLGAAVALGIAVGTGLAYGILLALGLSVFYAVSSTRMGADAPTRPGLPEAASEVTVAGPPEAILAAVRAAAGELKLSDIRETEPGVWQMKRGMSWRSYGEVITIELTPAGGATRARVHSRPRLPTTIMDHGQNAMNVQQIVALFDVLEVSS